MQIIKHGSIVEDGWIHLEDDAPLLSGQSVTVSLDRLKSLTDADWTTPSALGVRVSPAENIDDISPFSSKVTLINLVMQPFTDGRSFSQARNLREDLNYRGEIRVSGDFLRDQMFYLHRLGVDSFEFANGIDLNDRLKAFSEFSETYQAAQDTPTPLYRRRSA
jgi:uncharacterized protein (DUF934 family)